MAEQKTPSYRSRAGLAVLAALGLLGGGPARGERSSVREASSGAELSDDEAAERAATSVVRGALAPPPDGTRLVAADAVWSYQLAVAPTLQRQLGYSMWSALEVAAGSPARPEQDEKPAVTRPPGWPLALSGQAQGRAPFGAARKSATALVAPAESARLRAAALYALTRFSLPAGAEPPHLELRLRYRDGIAVWLNGVEITRRSLAGAPWQAAERPRGPEWETSYVPVTPGLLRREGNVLSVEVRPAAASEVPELALELYARRQARLVRGPMVQQVTEQSAVIVAETDVEVGATLSWQAREGLGATLTSPPGRRHAWQLAGLPRDRAITYRLSAGASQTAAHTFHTLPSAGATLRLGVYGDVRGGHEVHRRLAQALIDEAPDAVLVTGDLVLRGSDEGDWQRFFAVTEELLPRIPYYPAIGNHDLGRAGADGRRADQIFVLPPAPPGRPDGAYWYSVDLADVHVVFLDSNAYERIEQERWLEQDLAAARQRGVRAILAVTHDGPFSRGIHRGSKLARERYLPILAKHKVALLLSGHDHQYQRGRAGGVDYVVSGGGGAPLYAITCGVPGKRRCATDDGMRMVSKEFHYVMLTLTAKTLELCARRMDRTPLEPCQRLRL